MKIGIFDSGLGGLILLKSISKKLPEYSYVYLGDTKRVPYGNRSQKTIYEFTKQAIDYLFKQDCKIVVIACNTASTRALRKLQHEYLPKYYPDRKVLGVIIPLAEVVAQDQSINRVGVIATKATVSSKVITKEYNKLNPQARVFELATPLLVPLIESNQLDLVKPVLEKYLQKFDDKNISALLLGCTHYPLLKNQIRKIVGRKVRVISQDEIIPTKLKLYFKNHPEIYKALSKNNKVELRVTNIKKHYIDLVSRWFGDKVILRKIDL